MNLSIFDFNEHPVRIIDRDNQPWFVAADVCRVLDLANITEALRGLEGDELSSEILNSGGQGRDMRLISESGLYTLIFKSRKPQACGFRKWVTSEVLPAIRAKGTYTAPSGAPASDELPEMSGEPEGEPRGLAAIHDPISLPHFVGRRDETRDWTIEDHVRYGSAVLRLAKAWGIPNAYMETREFGMVRAVPYALAHYALEQLTRRLPGIDDSAARHARTLVSAMAEGKTIGEAWTTTEILQICEKENLFPATLTASKAAGNRLKQLGALLRRILIGRKIGSYLFLRRRNQAGAAYFLSLVEPA